LLGRLLGRLLRRRRSSTWVAAALELLNLPLKIIRRELPLLQLGRNPRALIMLQAVRRRVRRSWLLWRVRRVRMRLRRLAWIESWWRPVCAQPAHLL
tara:strand:+ start:203 stop:493 length:291 start_codon:yes stop_codon:yes gene_type:complete